MKKDKQNEWKSTNFWRSQWIVSNYKHANIMYSYTSQSGAISSDSDNKQLITVGLFMKQVYNKRAAAFVAYLVPTTVISTSRH